MTQNTIKALLARGLDSITSENLQAKGFTLQKLKLLNKNELTLLGLHDNFIDNLFNEQRPPIPPKTVQKLLYQSKFTCCICRDPHKSVVIHHINEWHKSRSHNEDNLVVLCLDHHNEAHTKRELATSLSIQHLKSHKKEWLESTLFQDSKQSLILKSNNNYSRWDYINYRRFTEILLMSKIEFEPNIMIDELISKNQIDRNYLIPNLNERRSTLNYSYFLNDGYGFKIAYLMNVILEQIIYPLPFIDITSYIKNKGLLLSIVKKHDFIFFQGNFFFKPIDKDKIHKAYYKAHQIRIEFTFDPFYCFSSSSKYDTMMGHSIINTYLQVINIEKDDDDIVHIKASCLFIGSHFQEHKARFERLNKFRSIQDENHMAHNDENLPF